MFAMIIGMMTGIFMAVYIAVYIFFQIVCMFVPGLIARFLVKRRTLTLEERKKFRRMYSVIFIALCLPILICGLIFGRNEEFFIIDYIGLIAVIGAELGIYLFVNTMILKKR